MDDAAVHLRAVGALVLWCLWAAPPPTSTRRSVGFHVAQGRFAAAVGHRGTGFPAYGEGVAVAGPWYRASGGKLCGGRRQGRGPERGLACARGGGGQEGQWERVRIREDVVL